MNKTKNIKINKIISVYDGDTFRGQVNAYPKWFGQNVGFRLYGIDTPEISWRAKCPAEAELAEIAKTFVSDYLLNAKSVEFDIVKWDKYGGRIDAIVRVDDIDLAELLIEAKLAVKYDGGKRPNWCKMLNQKPKREPNIK
jgi:endonuclease YncB( thermonuclease family)